MKNLAYISIIISILLYSCNKAYEEIDWELEEQPSRLVVEGAISNKRTHHKIVLRQSNSYFANKQSTGVSGASVTVSDGENLYSFVEDTAQKGAYISEARFAGRIGKTYTLNVELPEPINGETTYLASCKLNEGIDIDTSVSFIYENPFAEFEGEDSVILLVNVFGLEPPEIGNYYIVNLYKNSELINDTIDKQTVIYDDERGINGEYSLSFFFFEQMEETDKVTVEIKSVDKGYYEFIDGLKKAAQGYDPLGFSGPPANPVGNIQGGGAFGYFLATFVSRHSSFPEYAVEEE